MSVPVILLALVLLVALIVRRRRKGRVSGPEAPAHIAADASPRAGGPRYRFPGSRGSM
jgi:hypothetical protein